MVSTWTGVKGDKDLIFIEANSDKEEVLRNIYLKRTLCQKFSKNLHKNYNLKVYLFKCTAGLVFSFYCDRVSDLMMGADVDILMILADH